MSTDLQSAQDDLAYLRSLVSGSEARTRVTGQLFLAGGLIYAGQCLFHWGQAIGAVRVSGPLLLLGIGGPTVLFLLVMWLVLWRNRGVAQGGSTSKAVNAAFAATGSSNLVAIAVFATVAASQHNLLIWLLYPCMVFVLQGAAWLVGAILYRRLWHLAVALGWFATAVGMAATIGTSTFVLLATGGLLLFMAVPGAVMMRQAGKDA